MYIVKKCNLIGFTCDFRIRMSPINRSVYKTLSQITATVGRSWSGGDAIVGPIIPW